MKPLKAFYNLLINKLLIKPRNFLYRNIEICILHAKFNETLAVVIVQYIMFPNRSLDADYAIMYKESCTEVNNSDCSYEGHSKIFILGHSVRLIYYIWLDATVVCIGLGTDLQNRERFRETNQDRNFKWKFLCWVSCSVVKRTGLVAFVFIHEKVNM